MRLHLIDGTYELYRAHFAPRPGHTAPDGAPFPELLRTRRFDAGGVGRFLVSTSSLLSVRASASVQRHRHTFGPVIERDAHGTWFGETSFTASRGNQTWVVGVAMQQERYEAQDIQDSLAADKARADEARADDAGADKVPASV